MASPRSRTLPRRLSYGLLWIMVAFWTVFTAWRWFGPDVTWPVVVAVSFTPYIAAATLVPVLLSVWLRAVRLLTIFVLCACALTVALVPRAFNNGTAGADGPKLRVMTVNMLTGDADAGDVAKLADEHDIDVLAVQELSNDVTKALAGTTIDDQLPHHLLKPAEKAAGTGIYSRFELTEDKELSADGLFYNPAATLAVPKVGEVEFVAVHPSPPLNFQRTKTWRSDLRALPRAQDDGPPRVLAGDFNATVDHKTFRDLLDSGYDDAADYTGSGLAGTWPADVYLPKIALDHVVSSKNITPIDCQVHAVSGGDHRAITSTLMLPESER